MNTPNMPHRFGGFTLIELVVTVAIVGTLSMIALPMAELAVKRSKEQDLQLALRQIRDALDAYKQAVQEGHVLARVDSSGYPATLEELVDGVDDARSPVPRKLYFLRRLPRDPFAQDPQLAAAETWGTRSYESPPDDPQPGEDVFDVYSQAPGVGMNGIPYKEW